MAEKKETSKKVLVSVVRKIFVDGEQEVTVRGERKVEKMSIPVEPGKEIEINIEDAKVLQEAGAVKVVL